MSVDGSKYDFFNSYGMPEEGVRKNIFADVLYEENLQERPEF